MRESLSIIQEQIAWWIETGYTPSEAMAAMGRKISDARRTWGAVFDAASEAYTAIEGDADQTPLRLVWRDGRAA